MREIPIYITNLTANLYEYFGGKLQELALLETPNDIYIDRDGNLQKRRKHYPEPPRVSIGSCRELAERIVEGGKYETVLLLLQKKDSLSGFQSIYELLAPHTERSENLELRSLYPKSGLQTASPTHPESIQAQTYALAQGHHS